MTHETQPAQHQEAAMARPRQKEKSIAGRPGSMSISCRETTVPSGSLCGPRVPVMRCDTMLDCDMGVVCVITMATLR